MKMFATTVCACLLLMFSFVSSQDPPAATVPISDMFHCSRAGISCDNEAPCNSESGLCECTEGFQGYDCSVNSTMIITENCDCENGGTCVEDGTNIVCFCPDAYYGDKCENIRVSQTCFADSVEMTIVPFANDPSFQGLIYVYENPMAACILDQVDNTGVYTKQISFKACGEATNTTNADGDVELSFLVLVQYKSTILTEYDLQFEFVCVIKKSDSEVEVPGNMVTNDKEKSPIDKQKVSGELVPVELSLVMADTGEEITEPQGIGSKLKLVFKLNGGNVYDSFRVEQVTANNGLEDPAESLMFVENGCVSSDAEGIVTGFSGDQSDQVELPFKLFKFLYSNQVGFKVIVRLCKGTGSCNATVRLGIVLNDQGFPRVAAFTLPRGDCDMFEGVGRRRRAIEEEEFEGEEDEDSMLEKLDSPRVFVWIPGQEENKEGKLKPIDTKTSLTDTTFSIHKPGLCFQNIWFIVCMVSIVTAFTLLGALVTVICMRRRKSDKLDDCHTYVTTPTTYDNKGFGSTKF